jgi:hypothetical protein
MYDTSSKRESGMQADAATSHTYVTWYSLGKALDVKRCEPLGGSYYQFSALLPQQAAGCLFYSTKNCTWHELRASKFAGLTLLVQSLLTQLVEP